MNTPKKTKKNQTFYFRDFLNQSEFCYGAMVRTKVTYGRYSIDISDCTHKIQLHGSFEDRENKENAIYKIDTLMKALSDTKDKIIEKYDEIIIAKEREQKIAKEKKQKIEN